MCVCDIYECVMDMTGPLSPSLRLPPGLWSDVKSSVKWKERFLGASLLPFLSALAASASVYSAAAPPVTEVMQSDDIVLRKGKNE